MREIHAEDVFRLEVGLLGKLHAPNHPGYFSGFKPLLPVQQGQNCSHTRGVGRHPYVGPEVGEHAYGDGVPQSKRAPNAPVSITWSTRFIFALRMRILIPANRAAFASWICRTSRIVTAISRPSATFRRRKHEPPANAVSFLNYSRHPFREPAVRPRIPARRIAAIASIIPEPQYPRKDFLGPRTSQMAAGLRIDIDPVNGAGGGPHAAGYVRPFESGAGGAARPPERRPVAENDLPICADVHD